jgi:hypothetical protein
LNIDGLLRRSLSIVGALLAAKGFRIYYVIFIFIVAPVLLSIDAFVGVNGWLMKMIAAVYVVIGAAIWVRRVPSGFLPNKVPTIGILLIGIAAGVEALCDLQRRDCNQIGLIGIVGIIWFIATARLMAPGISSIDCDQENTVDTDKHTQSSTASTNDICEP